MLRSAGTELGRKLGVYYEFFVEPLALPGAAFGYRGGGDFGEKKTEG
jgi:hypothetical protein